MFLSNADAPRNFEFYILSLTTYKFTPFTKVVTQISSLRFFFSSYAIFFLEEKNKLLKIEEKCFKTVDIFSNIFPFHQIEFGKEMIIQRAPHTQRVPKTCIYIYTYFKKGKKLY